VGDTQIAWNWVAGVFLLLVLLAAHVFDGGRLRNGLGATILAAVIAMMVVYLAQCATSVTLHSLSLTPERAIFTIVGALLLFPFWLSFEFMLRRGGLLMSTLRSAVGRALIVVMLVVGVILQVLPGVLMLILPQLVLIYVAVEIYAASAYSSSRNLLLIALVESIWFSWSIAAVAPITFMF